LCDYLTIMGLLTKQDGQYGLTGDSAFFLDRRSPACIASATKFLASGTVRSAFDHLTEAVRKGATALSAEGTMEPEHPAWVSFARDMAPMIAPSAFGIAEVLAAHGPIT